MSDQSGQWIDVFAIIPTDLGKSLQSFLNITGLMVSAVTYMSLRRVRHICNLQKCANLFSLISIARYVQSSRLNIRSRGAKFEIFRKHCTYLHYMLCTVASTRIFIFAGFFFFWRRETKARNLSVFPSHV